VADNTVEQVVHNLLLDEIHADDSFNCRGKITPLDVMDLAKDIEERGLIQPVVCRDYSEEDQQKTGKKYKLMAGFRRYMAHRMLHRDRIQVLINNSFQNEADEVIFNISENTQRQDLNITQEAKAIARLKLLGLTEADTAVRLNKSRGWVQVRYMLLNLPKEIQSEVAGGFINQNQIRELYTLSKRQGCSTQQLFEVTKKLKEAKQKGSKISAMTVSPKSQAHTKKHQARPNIFKMQATLQRTFGNGLSTGILAWCAGEITTNELYALVERRAKESGLVFLRPQSGDTDFI
jgi:ParB family chromosome partitioning protein